eukprot:11211423-Lingulodinium_polyedra.AAC.1
MDVDSGKGSATGESTPRAPPAAGAGGESPGSACVGLARAAAGGVAGCGLPRAVPQSAVTDPW